MVAVPEDVDLGDVLTVEEDLAAIQLVEPKDSVRDDTRAKL